MHPDNLLLAAYLDGAIDPDERAELRAHMLTCPACTARLERLRDDARRIDAALGAGAVQDVRAAVRARLRRPAPGAWLARGAAATGAIAALLLFAMLIGSSRGGTAGRTPDRLFVTDKQGGRLLVLDPRDGARVGASSVGEAPSSITYDGTRDRLYVMLKQAIVAVDPSTLRTIDRWEAPQPFDPNGAMALDARGGRLYVPQPQGVTALALDKPQLMATNTYTLGAAPGGLALSPDGAALFALDPQQARLWTIDISGGSATSQVLAPARTRNGWLATSQDGQSVYVLLTGAAAGDRPALWRVDRRGQAGAPAALAQAPPPWDMELTRAGQLAIARGDGTRGGIELLDPTTLTTTARLDPDYDQHHAVVGPDGALFGLNFTHRTATRFDAGAHTVVWRTPEDSGWQPWDGVLVPGGWRWPW